MPSDSQILSFEEFGDLLQREWEKGNLGTDLQEFIARTGSIPAKYLREELSWIIERHEDGLKITKEVDNTSKTNPANDTASKNVGYKPLDNRKRFE